MREGKQKRNDLRFRVHHEGGDQNQDDDDDYEDVKVIKDYDESKALIEGINSKGYWEYHPLQISGS